MESINLGKYSFLGPLDGARFLYMKKGIFAVLCRDIRETGKFYVVDVDESDDVRSAAINHERQVDWVKACRETGKLAIAVYYTGEMERDERIKIKKYIRGLYDVPCGE
ncbi:MAG: hypothetical protein ACLFP1_09090 [Candidatus Goldiibacteriota bacterium]